MNLFLKYCVVEPPKEEPIDAQQGVVDISTDTPVASTEDIKDPVEPAAAPVEPEQQDEPEAKAPEGDTPPAEEPPAQEPEVVEPETKVDEDGKSGSEEGKQAEPVQSEDTPEEAPVLADCDDEEVRILPPRPDTISLVDEFVEMTKAVLHLDDALGTVVSIGKVKSHIKDHGCTDDLITLCGNELEAVGVTLETDDAIGAQLALEGLTSGINLENIKKILLRIVDAIVRVFEKFDDANKKYSNELKELIRGKLSKADSIDPEKFTNIIISAYAADDFLAIASGISKLDLAADVSGDEDLTKAVNDKLTKLLKTAGYEVSATRIDRSGDVAIHRKKMGELGWVPGKLKDAAAKTQAMLDALRLYVRKIIDQDKRAIKDLKDDPEKAKELKQKLKNHMSVIVPVERISIVLAKQIIEIASLTKIKSN